MQQLCCTRHPTFEVALRLLLFALGYDNAVATSTLSTTSLTLGILLFITEFGHIFPTQVLNFDLKTKRLEIFDIKNAEF